MRGGDERGDLRLGARVVTASFQHSARRRLKRQALELKVRSSGLVWNVCFSGRAFDGPLSQKTEGTRVSRSGRAKSVRSLTGRGDNDVVVE